MNLKLAVIELDVGPAQNVRFGSKTDIRRKKGMSALSREVEIYSTVADVCYGQNQKFGRLLPNIGTLGPLDIAGPLRKSIREGARYGESYASNSLPGAGACQSSSRRLWHISDLRSNVSRVAIFRGRRIIPARAWTRGWPVRQRRHRRSR